MPLPGSLAGEESGLDKFRVVTGNLRAASSLREGSGSSNPSTVISMELREPHDCVGGSVLDVKAWTSPWKHPLENELMIRR